MWYLFWETSIPLGAIQRVRIVSAYSVGQYDSCANGTGIGSRAELNCYIPTEKIYIHKDNVTKQVG